MTSACVDLTTVISMKTIAQWPVPRYKSTRTLTTPTLQNRRAAPRGTGHVVAAEPNVRSRSLRERSSLGSSAIARRCVRRLVTHPVTASHSRMRVAQTQVALAIDTPIARFDGFASAMADSPAVLLRSLPHDVSAHPGGIALIVHAPGRSAQITDPPRVERSKTNESYVRPRIARCQRAKASS
jgi:hypothetical protein